MTTSPRLRCIGDALCRTLARVKGFRYCFVWTILFGVMFLESWFLFKLRIEQNVFGCFQIVSEFLCSMRVLIGRAAASLQGRIQRAALPQQCSVMQPLSICSTGCYRCRCATWNESCFWSRAGPRCQRAMRRSRTWCANSCEQTAANSCCLHPPMFSHR